MSGKIAVRLIANSHRKLIVSEPLLSPAAHSPPTAPEAAFVLAAEIASRNVHKPSVLFTTS
jgi:hypothetical protein